MKRIDDRMNKFRDASVQVWNEYLCPGEDVLDLQVEEALTVIERELLRVLVLKECPEQADAYGWRPLDCLVVEVNAGVDPGRILQSVPGGNGSIVLQPLSVRLAPSGKLLFQAFYDWHHYSNKVSNDLVKVVDSVSGIVYRVPVQDCAFWLDTGPNSAIDDMSVSQRGLMDDWPGMADFESRLRKLLPSIDLFRMQRSNHCLVLSFKSERDFLALVRSASGVNIASGVGWMFHGGHSQANGIESCYLRLQLAESTWQENLLLLIEDIYMQLKN